MNCLVTGAGGFIGGFLVESLVDRRYPVHAIARRATEALDRLGHRVHVYHGDVTDRGFVQQVTQQARPDAVFHLAAQSLPVKSWESPRVTYETNVIGTVHLLEALRGAELEPRIVMVSSSSIYAPSPGGEPINEDGPMRPATPYAVSKLAQDQMASLYHEQHGMHTVRARPFFLIGPRKRGDVCSDFARRVVAIERGDSARLPVGDLEVVRDFLDVRDGVEALCVLAEKGEPGCAYNVCSGKGVRIAEVLDCFKSLASVSCEEAQDPNLLRPIEERIKVGDPGRLGSLGWTPQTDLNETLDDILAFWREQ